MVRAPEQDDRALERWLDPWSKSTLVRQELKEDKTTPTGLQTDLRASNDLMSILWKERSNCFARGLVGDSRNKWLARLWATPETLLVEYARPVILSISAFAIFPTPTLFPGTGIRCRQMGVRRRRFHETRNP